MAAAGFSGGEALQAKLAEIAKQIEGKHVLRVGFLENATHTNSDASIPQIAWWLNYGTKSSPPRPFFSGMVAEKSDSWGDSLARILARNGFDVENALNLMGEGISDQLRVSLENIPGPQLSPITLMLRQMRIDNPHLEINGTVVGQAAKKVADGDDYSGASTKIGVYTGELLNAIAYKVD